MFFLIIASLIALFLILPYLRILIKRITLYFKLRALCRRRKLRLHGGHPLWLFARKNDARFDFYLESDDTVLAVKLFAVKRKNATLYFIGNASYRTRSYIALFSKIGTNCILPIDSAERALPQYEVSIKNDAWYTKTMRKVLLLHPVCSEIRRCGIGQEQIIGSSDTVGNMTLSAFSALDSLFFSAKHTI